MVDTADLKSAGGKTLYGFESRLRHHYNKLESYLSMWAASMRFFGSTIYYLCGYSSIGQSTWLPPRGLRVQTPLAAPFNYKDCDTKLGTTQQNNICYHTDSVVCLYN